MRISAILQWVSFITLVPAVLVGQGSAPSKTAAVARIDPATAVVPPGRTFQFAFSGAPEPSLHWFVSVGDGWVSQAGAYTAPLNAGDYRIQVKSRSALIAEATITVPVVVQAHPQVSVVFPGANVQFDASIEGSDDKQIRWFATEGRLISRETAQTSYVAPDRPGTYFITASRQQNAEHSCTAKVIVIPKPATPPLAEEPPSEGAPWIYCFVGDKVQLPQPKEDGPWAWSSSTGNVNDQGVFDAPLQEGNASVTALHLFEPRKSKRYGIVFQRIQLEVAPGRATMGVKGSEQLAAITDAGEVAWSIQEPDGGTVTGFGLYTAPDRPGSFTVAVTSLRSPLVQKKIQVKVEENGQAEMAGIPAIHSDSIHPVFHGIMLSPTLSVVDAGTYANFSVQETAGGETKSIWSAKAVVDGKGEVMEGDGLFTAAGPGLYEIKATDGSNPEIWGTALVLVKSSISAISGTPRSVQERGCFFAVLLEDGRVFQGGGQNLVGVPLASCFLYNIETSRFTEAIGLQSPRALPLAAHLAGGKVLVLSGTGAWVDVNGAKREGPVPTAELLDVPHGVRIPLEVPAGGGLPGQLEYLHVGGRITVLKNGDALLSGGGKTSKDVAGPSHLFELETKKFIQLEGPDLGQGHAAIRLGDGRVLISGGFEMGPDREAPTSKLWIYDPSNRKIMRAGLMSVPRVGHTMTLAYDGKVVIAGGSALGRLGAPTSTTAQTEVWDPSTGKTHQAGRMHRGRQDHAAVLLPTGQILVMGGWAAQRGGKRGFPAELEMFSPDDSKWTVRDVGKCGVEFPILLTKPDGGILTMGTVRLPD